MSVAEAGVPEGPDVAAGVAADVAALVREANIEAVLDELDRDLVALGR